MAKACEGNEPGIGLRGNRRSDESRGRRFVEPLHASRLLKPLKIDLRVSPRCPELPAGRARNWLSRLASRGNGSRPEATGRGKRLWRPQPAPKKSTPR